MGEGLADRMHWGLAFPYYSEANYVRAHEHLAVSIPILRDLRDTFSLAWALHLSGLIAIRTADRAAARTALGEALKLFSDARDLSGIVMVLDDFSALATAEGDPERAARLAGGAAALQQSSGADLATLAATADGRARPGAAELDQKALAAAWEEGRTMALDEIVAYALRRG